MLIFYSLKQVTSNQAAKKTMPRGRGRGYRGGLRSPRDETLKRTYAVRGNAIDSVEDYINQLTDSSDRGNNQASEGENITNLFSL